MFVRKKKNRSGTTSVIVVDKSYGRFHELKTIGISSDETEICALVQKAKLWINQYTGQLSLDFDSIDNIIHNVENTL